MTRLNLGTVALLALAWLCAPSAAHAAQSYDNCTAFITSLPAVISTQGTWCLKTDLTTAITSGQAITINTNNVTIDCNDFKLGGLAAGAGTLTNGISAGNRLNATVRHCNIRGFYQGVYFFGSSGGGHVIEDNRLDGNIYTGLHVEGDGSVLRRNLVSDTGGAPASVSVFGIYTFLVADILDNTISGVTATGGTNGSVYGIYTDSNSSGSMTGNRVRSLVKDGTGAASGIYNLQSGHIDMRGNFVVGDGNVGSIGLRCFLSNGSAKDNVISSFETAIQNCTDSGGNAIIP